MRRQVRFSETRKSRSLRPDDQLQNSVIESSQRQNISRKQTEVSPEIQNKIDNINTKQLQNHDIKDFLQDVQAYSIPHFENMDQHLVNEIRQVGKNHNSHDSTSSGWKIFTDIVQKYPQKQSVALAIHKLKQEAQQIAKDQDKCDAASKPRRTSQRKKSRSRLTLEDFKSCLGNQSMEHFQSIKANVEQLQVIKDEFKKLKLLDEEQKNWMLKFNQYMKPKHKEFKRQNVIKRQKIRELIGLKQSETSKQDTMLSQISQIDSTLMLNSICTDDSRLKNSQISTSKFKQLLNESKQQQTRKGTEKDRSNNNSQARNSSNIHSKKALVSVKQSPFKIIDTESRLSKLNKEFSEKMVEVKLNIQKDSLISDHRAQFQVNEAQRGGFVKVQAQSDVIEIVQVDRKSSSLSRGNNLSPQMSSNTPTNVYQLGTISRRDNIKKRYNTLLVRKKQYRESLSNCSMKQSAKNSVNQSMVLLSRRQTNSRVLYPLEYNQSPYQQVCTSVQTAKSITRPKYDFTMELIDSIQHNNMKSENRRYQNQLRKSANLTAINEINSKAVSEIERDNDRLEAKMTLNIPNPGRTRTITIDNSINYLQSPLDEVTYDIDKKPHRFNEMILSVQNQSSIENLDISVKSPLSILDYGRRSKVNQSLNNLKFQNGMYQNDLMNSNLISPKPFYAKEYDVKSTIKQRNRLRSSQKQGRNDIFSMRKQLQPKMPSSSQITSIYFATNNSTTINHSMNLVNTGSLKPQLKLIGNQYIF
ncbi:UNKNOWN [Stylonychia lemnae]|uniref:Uncharacterized protein n=1 Tax=Stylonychia lemnae TaxID=5949 RepID=A0A078BFB8_STYLE|nr:UNKNOWN [Stylonychia lemnae]|eukprot:CDW91837.1 UNKNOWN [Stylonychia lemnae]